MELNIFFKNVGQGDTLMIDWLEDTDTPSRKFGMVDCNLYRQNIDSVINHIENNKIKRFEFVVMSHPHSDHFSGFMKFLQYCETKNIFIEYFIHTACLDPKHLSVLAEKEIKTGDAMFDEATLGVNYPGFKDILRDIYVFLRKQYKKKDGFIKRVCVADSFSKDIYLTNEISIKFIAPTSSYDELEMFFTKTYKSTNEEKLHFLQKPENNPHANFLSSFLQIVDKKRNWQILLCSDITSDTLDRIINDEEYINGLKGKRTLAAQIPHHGSKRNHVKEFWSQLDGIEDSHILISVGSGYDHPDKEVIEFFYEKCKSIHATNFVGGYRDYFINTTLTSESQEFTMIMDLPGINMGEKENKHKDQSKFPRCCEKQIQIRIDQNGRVSCEVLDI